MIQDPIQAWHGFVESRDPSQLTALLHPDVVFESPVVHSPQRGRAIASKYLVGAMQILGNPSFAYLGEWRADRSAILEFGCEIEGVAINGIDMIHWDEAGQITSFKVMVRPLKAMNMVHQKMGEMLARL